MFVDSDPPPYVHLTTPNRSLGVAARRWAVVAIAAPSVGIAAAAALVGAWPVMPFAGLEVAFLALAFRALGMHDADYERLEIGDHEVSVEVRDARQVRRFVAYRPWARVLLRERGTRCTLRLAYAGRTEPLGRLLTDEGRRELAATLRGRIRVTAH